MSWPILTLTDTLFHLLKLVIISQKTKTAIFTLPWWTLVSLHEFCIWEGFVLYPCEVGADLQLRQRLADVSAQLCSGGVWLLVVTARVVEGAVDTGPNQAQVEVEFPCSFLENLQTHTDVLQGLLGFSHGWIERDRSWDWKWRGLLLRYEGKIRRCKKNAHWCKEVS